MLTAVTKEPVLSASTLPYPAASAAVASIMPPDFNKASWIKTSNEYMWTLSARMTPIACSPARQRCGHGCMCCFKPPAG